MYLKEIEIQGFKSFADKTKVVFDQGVTAVVGPNGSGKSNITESLRWALGESSVKSLRGGKMPDVIFAGTESRKPLNYASVVVTLDNHDGFIKDAGQEIRVERHIYRSGDSEYKIDGKKVRLRDIHDLFLDTGLGRDSFSIISQGKANGKTTTKDMTAMVLQAKYRVHKTQGNYNNEIGLPYTLLQMPEDTQVAVIEMGMSDFGEIKQLSEIAQPDIAAITLIGESHLEFLGSRAGIAQAKLEILYGLKPNGVLLYPANEPLIESEMPEIDQPIYLRSFGFTDHADAFAYDMVEEVDRTYFKTNLEPNVTCTIPVLGAYNVSNALIALSVAELLDVPLEQAIFQLANFQLTANRLEWLTTHQGARLLNDAYNASPTSVLAVLKSLAALNLAPGQRRIAVLGDVRELGEASAQLHRSLAQGLAPESFERVYLFGPEIASLYEALQDRYEASHLFYEPADHSRLIAQLQADLTDKDLVLVKSSFGTDLLQVVTALTGKETH